MDFGFFFEECKESKGKPKPYIGHRILGRNVIFLLRSFLWHGTTTCVASFP
ncbi:unnamed protein product [Larinioides sclopetarius]|uniref:Uncharacterized protein n=1 Tax=Larinioides sclopetarius TaxID=280406 RepID=A0AAV1ZIG1_9ARAC